MRIKSFSTLFFVIASLLRIEVYSQDISASPDISSGCPGTQVTYTYVYYGTGTITDLTWEIDPSGSGSIYQLGGNSVEVTWSNAGTLMAHATIYYPMWDEWDVLTSYKYFNSAAPSAGTISVTPAASVTRCYGANINFSIGGNSGPVTWQKCVSGCSTTNDTGWTTTAFPVTGLTTSSQFRAKLNDTSCGVRYSNVISINVYSPFQAGVIDGGNGPPLCGDSPIDIHNEMDASGGASSPVYQWQMSQGGSFYDIQDATSAAYEIPEGTIPPGQTYQFKRLAMDNGGCGEWTESNTVSITAAGVLLPGTLPAGTSICSGTNPPVITEVTSPSGGGGYYTYSWQSSLDNQNWSSQLSTVASYDPPQPITQRTYYRRTVFGDCDVQPASATTYYDIYSTSAGTISGPAAVCFNASGSFSISGNTGSVSWQNCTSGCSTVDDSGWSSASNSFTDLTSTTKFRAKLNDNSCGTKYSNIIETVVAPTFAIGAIAPGDTIYQDESFVIQSTVDATGGLTPVAYQWQVDMGTGFQNLPGATQSTYNVPVGQVPVFKSYKYRRGAKSVCESGFGYTDPVVVAVERRPDYNYVKEEVLLVADVSENEIAGLPNTKKAVMTTYFDGLGRKQQVVSWQTTPSGRDLVTPIGYDEFGREAAKFLPYGSTEDNGLYKRNALADPWSTEPDEVERYRSGRQYAFYQNQGLVANDQFPYEVKALENSPLNRVKKQGGPGQAWQPDGLSYGTTTDHSIKYAYESNGANEVLRWTYTAPTSGLVLGLVNAGTATLPTYYAANELFKKRTKDEDQHEVIEYKDKLDRVVLKSVEGPNGTWAQTYHIYDAFGSLVTVLPPEATARLTTEYLNQTNDTNKDNFLKRWAFRYRYDNRHRMSIKQVPGVEAVYMVYDGRDRLVLTQTGNQRSTSTRYWTFTKYDNLNRPILTGIKDTAVLLTQSEMQNVVDSHYQKPWAKSGESFIGDATGNIHGYSNKAYPVVTSASATNVTDYLTVTYYDNYDFKDTWTDEYDYSFKGLTETIDGMVYELPQSQSLQVIGQVTGGKTKVLDGGVRGGELWLYAVNYYDDRYRLIQGVRTNYLGGRDRATNLYDFTGKVLISETEHVRELVTWKDLVGSQKAGNKLFKSATGSGWNTAGAASVEQLPQGHDGWMEVTVSELNKQRMIGFSDQNTDTHHNTLDYAFYLNNSNLVVYENGSNKGTIGGGIERSDRLKIARTGTTVKYYRNDELVYTSTKASNTALMVDVAFNNSGSVLNVRSSFSRKEESVTRRFRYDHAGRLQQVWHRVNSEPEILLVKNEYNETGQLIDKKLHSTVSLAQDARQSVDFSYNIRGWLTKINEIDLAANTSEPGDYFGMQLGYNETLGVGNAPLFNGNVSGAQWSANSGVSDEKMRGYVYTYDPMNRITSATYKTASGAYTNLSWNVAPGNAYSESGYTYDLNGNIGGLTRRGEDGDIIDLLTYNYGSGTNRSNKLLFVTDSEDDSKGFVEMNSPGNDYVYDANGNMTFDRNKGGKELLKNGGFDNGNADWIVTDAAGRLSFTSGAVQITANATTAANFVQNDILSPSVGYLIVIDMVRTSASGQVSLNVGGTNVNITASGQTVVNVTAGSSKNFSVNIAAGTFEGSINSIQVMGVAVTAYNYLNLPEKVTKGGDHYLSYYYDATGKKLAQELFVATGELKKRSDYAGEYFYENDTLRFIHHDEGRVVTSEDDPEYQYHIKDHLGNVRVTFTTKDDVQTDIATLETENGDVEQAAFLHYNEAVVVNHEVFDHTSNGGTNETYKATRLIGGNTDEIFGLARSLSVMPGDQINMEVWAKYLDPDPLNWQGAFEAFLTQYTSGGAPPNTIVDGGLGGSIGSGLFPYATLLEREDVDETAPKVFLTWLVFDREFNPILEESGFVQIGASGTLPRENGTNVPHERLARPTPLLIKEPGYVYIYLSNENEDPVEVFFDDFRVEHIKSPVIQVDDYYPFGATFNSFSREDNVRQDFLYQGKEWQQDLSLNFHDFQWRQYDAFTGRTTTLDPKADKYAELSPYSWVANNPLRIIDPDGQEIITYTGLAAQNFLLYLQRQSNSLAANSNKSDNTGTFSEGFARSKFRARRGDKSAQQGDPPSKGWFTRFGELFEKNYNGGVVYDGDAWYGSNFIGPSDAVDPYKIPDPKRPGQFLKPKDMVDAAAQRHDSYYYLLKVDGVTGALFATRVTFADQILAAEAYKAFTGYFRGDIDPVTGSAISPRTRDVAFDIMVSFGLIGGAKSKF